MKKKLLSMFLAATLLFSMAPQSSLVVLATQDGSEIVEERDSEKSEQRNILNQVLELTPGTDYKENVLLFRAQSEEEAEAVASKVNASLGYYRHGCASLIIDIPVKDFLQDICESEEELPVFSINHVHKLIEEDQDLESSNSASTQIASNEESARFSSDEIVTYTNSSVYEYDDPGLKQSWYHDFLGTTAAWKKGYTGKGVTVAVLDTGVANNHPDLKVEKYIDSLYEWSDEGGDTPYDTNGHGTKVAGLIAMQANNGIGGVGIAPDVTLISCKVATSRGIFYDDTINWGIYDAVDAGADVINISCAFDEDAYGWLEDAIDYAVEHSCVIVAAAGNEGSLKVKYLPSHEYVIGVGSLDKKANRCSNSNYGENVNIMAPGVSMYTTTKDGKYGQGSATSAASPIVAGAAAIAISMDADLLQTATDGSGSLKGEAFVKAVQNKLFESATKVEDVDHYGNGKLNIASLVGTHAVDPVINLTGEVNGNNISNNALISLTTEEDVDAIYYTLNGKVPNPSTGILYENAFHIEKKGKVTIKAIAVKDGLIGNVVSGTYNVTVFAKDVDITSTAFMDNGDLGVALGKTIVLKTQVLPTGTTNKKLKWTCNDSGVATVSNGRIKGKAIGETVITVEALGASADTPIQLQKTVHVYPATTSVTTAKTMELTIEGQDDGSVQYGQEQLEISCAPEGTMGIYTYKSSNVRVASVDENGVVTAVGPGKATVSVTAADGTNKKASCKVTVTVPVKSVKIVGKTGWYDESQNAYIVGAGKGINLGVQFNPENPTNKKVVWSSSDALIKAGNGKVSTKKTANGRYTVTVTSKENAEIYSSADVFVYPATQKLTLDQTVLQVDEGQTVDIPEVSVAPADAYNGHFAIKSSNAKVVTVDEEKGTIYGVAPGTAYVTIMACDGSRRTAKCKVTVRQSTRVTVEGTIYTSSSGGSLYILNLHTPMKLYYENTKGNVVQTKYNVEDVRIWAIMARTGLSKYVGKNVSCDIDVYESDEGELRCTLYKISAIQEE